MKSFSWREGGMKDTMNAVLQVGLGGEWPGSSPFSICSSQNSGGGGGSVLLCILPVGGLCGRLLPHQNLLQPPGFCAQ